MSVVRRRDYQRRVRSVCALPCPTDPKNRDECPFTLLIRWFSAARTVYADRRVELVGTEHE